MGILKTHETAIIFSRKCRGNAGKIIGLAGCMISPLLAAAEPDLNKIMPVITDKIAQMQTGVIGPKTPVIDGIISPGEWDSAAMLSGFHELNGDMVPEKSGFVYVMSDDKFLYLAIKTITRNDSPGGGLVSTVNKRDGEVYNDDCVELTFNGDNEPDFIKQLIFNPDGFLFDSRRRISVKDVDISWDIQGMEAKSRVESFWWILELKIPLNQLDIKNGKLRFNVLRRWLELGMFSTIKRVQKYFDPQEMIELSLDPGGIIIRQEELGNPTGGDWDIKFSATNTSAHESIFAVMLHNYVWPKIDGKVTRIHTVNILKSKTLKPGGSGVLEGVFKVEGKDNRLFWLSSGIVDSRTGKLQPHRRITAKKARSLGRQPVYASGELPKNGSFIAYDYPGFGHGVIKFNFEGTPPESLLITSPDGTRETVKFIGTGNRQEVRVPIGSKPGKYSVSLSNGIPVCDFYRKEFEWLNNKYGTEKVVLPPFTPLLAKKEQIDVIFRKHRINGFGLWDSILSKEQELLQSPMRFELVSGGKNADWRFMPVESEVKNAGHDAEYTTRATSSTGVTISVNGKAEYDGFFWNRFTVDNPDQSSIDRLTLVIPLKNQMAPLFHIISNTIRSNPAGFLPEGQGKLWDGTQLVRQLHAGKAVMHRQLVPYVWLGGVERGLCWFLDSSFGYNLSPVNPMVRISRHDQELRLEVDIVNLPTTREKWTFEFGLQATPVKPINPELFKMTRDMRGFTADKIPNLLSFNPPGAGLPSSWAGMPLAGDYSLYRTVTSLIQNGQLPNKDFRSVVESFFEKHKSVLEDGLKSEYPKQAALVITSARGIDTFLNNPQRKPSRPIMYTDPYLAYRYEDAVRYFKSEWWNPAVQDYIAVYRVSLTPTRLDYLVYSMHEFFRNGLRGINLDDTYLMPNDNPDTVAKTDSQGIVHSEIGILRMRSYIKRLATMMHTEFNIYPRYIEPHMTNTLLVPAFSFADAQLGFEQYYGEDLATDRFSTGEILATYTGRQIGAKPIGLQGIRRRNAPAELWDQNRMTLSRSFLALMMPFGIMIGADMRNNNEAIDYDVVYNAYNNLAAFGIAEDDCVFVPCFENDGAVLSDQDDIRIASYRRPGQALIIISNFGKTPRKIQLKIDPEKLGIPAKFQTLNWESRKPIDGEFSLAPGDFRLLRLGNAIVFEEEVLKPADLKGFQENANLSVENGIFVCKGSSVTVLSDKAFLVDPAKKYRISGTFRAKPGTEPAVFCFGYVPYNAKNARIVTAAVNGFPDTETELAEAAKIGDTVLKVKDASKWNMKENYGVVAFNVKPNFDDLPNDEFADVVPGKIENKNDVWEITLNAPLKKAFVQGTGIRQQTHRGSTCIYNGAAGRKTSGDWQTFSGIITGIAKTGNTTTQWWPGTKSARILILANLNAKNNPETEFKDIIVETVN